MNRILIVITMCLYRFKRGRANHVPSHPQHILVVQMAKLGDMVCTTPLLHAIKKAYPQVQITVMGNRLNEAVLKDNPDIDRYLVFAGIRPTAKVIRGTKFDAALLAGGLDLGSLATAFFAGVPCIVAPSVEGGWSPLNDAWYRIATRCVITVPNVMGRYIPREYLRLLEPLNVFTDDTHKYLFYSPAAGETARRFFEGRRLSGLVIGIAPAAGNKVKEWPPERFAAIADYVVEKYDAQVIIVGSGKDKREVEGMITHCKYVDRILNTLDQFSIDELKAVIAKLSLFISVDTGPIYIAEAFTIPTIDITGPIDEREQPPIGELHLVVTPPSRSAPQLFGMNARRYDYAETRRQAESVTVDMVQNACDILLRRLGFVSGNPEVR